MPYETVRVRLLGGDAAMRTRLRRALDVPGLELVDDHHADTDVLLVAGGGDADLRATPSVGVVFLGGDRPRMSALRASSRAWGWLPGGAGAGEMVAALRAVAHGLVVLPPAVMAQAAPAPPVASPTGDVPGSGDTTAMEDLTARELDVLELVAEGLSNRAIGRRLGISEHTVKFHVASICGKLGASGRTEAVRMGIRRGVISL